MRIHLVRHGEALAPWHEADDPDLSERGRTQAAEAARRLSERIDRDSRILSSPLIRARETARPLCDMLGAQAVIAEAFREIPAPVAMADRQKWLGSVYQQGWGAQIDRVQAWRRTVLDALTQLREPTVVFTHFMVLNAVVGEVTDDDRLVCFVPENASITTLEWRGDRLELVQLGEQNHRVLRDHQAPDEERSHEHS